MACPHPSLPLHVAICWTWSCLALSSWWWGLYSIHDQLRTWAYCMPMCTACHTSVCVCVRDSSPWDPPLLLSIFSIARRPFHCKASPALLSLAIILYTVLHHTGLLSSEALRSNHTQSYMCTYGSYCMHAWQHTSCTLVFLWLLLSFTFLSFHFHPSVWVFIFTHRCILNYICYVK